MKFQVGDVVILTCNVKSNMVSSHIGRSFIITSLSKVRDRVYAKCEKIDGWGLHSDELEFDKIHYSPLGQALK